MKPLGVLAFMMMALTLAACGVSGSVLPSTGSRDAQTLKAVPIPTPSPSPSPSEEPAPKHAPHGG